MFDHHHGSLGRRAAKIAGVIVIAALGVTALGFLVTALWNALLPGLFGFRTIHFWQGLGLLLLTRILFGGFHHGRGHGFRHRHHIIERWEKMTPEEREKFRSGLHHRCHRWGGDEPADEQAEK